MIKNVDEIDFYVGFFGDDEETGTDPASISHYISLAEKEKFKLLEIIDAEGETIGFAPVEIAKHIIECMNFCKDNSEFASRENRF